MYICSVKASNKQRLSGLTVSPLKRIAELDVVSTLFSRVNLLQRGFGVGRFNAFVSESYTSLTMSRKENGLEHILVGAYDYTRISQVLGSELFNIMLCWFGLVRGIGFAVVISTLIVDPISAHNAELV